MKKDIDLMCLFWTTSGIAPGEGEISRFDFKDRVEAVAKAGFKGTGIWHTDLEQVLHKRSLKEMKTILDDHGIQYLELEFLTDWFLEGEKKRESDKRRKLLMEAAGELGAKHIKVGDFYNSPHSMPQTIEAFAALCAEAEQHGTTIGFEFMASAMINNIQDARRLVETAGAKNGGLILDIVHIVNCGITYDEISQIPLQYLLNFELNDGFAPDSPKHDPSGMRKFCGEGEFDIRGLIQCADKMGYVGPWAVEVFSEEVARLPLQEAARRAFQTTIAQFEA